MHTPAFLSQLEARVKATSDAADEAGRALQASTAKRRVRFGNAGERVLPKELALDP